MSQVLVIAGFDPSGGAGLLMDVKVLTLQGMQVSAVPSALTFQSYSRFEDWIPLNSLTFERFLKIIFEDLRVEGIKLGMLATPEIVEKTAFYIERYKVQIKWVVADPVLKATLNKALFQGKDYLEVLKGRLFPLVDVLTPNVPEAEKLTGIKIRDHAEARRALKVLQDSGIRFPVLTGFKGENRIYILFLNEKGRVKGFSVKSLPAEFHGTGCALSSAILAYLMKGYPLDLALKKGLTWLWKRLKRSFNRKLELQGSGNLQLLPFL
ncbi:phosphomethylpyrimidine kinase [Caldimicrobium thiodismutans]|uniref:hydroxymethylpyrimidine kinase n=1 Tax=Caldimicrobium thiodismutans TaxID=1653476 RepID=A0A0U5ANZ3_9BACT|nr:hydroxymethylpyrimidine/phosphomethylpyrimidine kinase [Caldimicrobium thiodismutans]BAU23812.1 phosphomethylpyrimidine kinase [Caldimicrobium thiodismutans]